VLLSQEKSTRLGHERIETTQVYAQIQPAQLKESVKFYEARALNAVTT